MDGQRNFVRRRSDYAVMAVFLALMVAAGCVSFPAYSTEEDLRLMSAVYDPLGLGWSSAAKWVGWYFITVAALHGLTWSLFLGFLYINKKDTPIGPTFFAQARAIETNFFLLPLVQVVCDIATQDGWTKVTMGNTEPALVLRDVLLWMLCFEWAWYVQHRLMHDVKPFWKYGHYFHHQWKKPEHMLGITNFAFDHVVEVWVTMSSSFLGYLLFPSNFYVGKAIALVYMVLAVLAHWEGFHLSRYHINHHYLVTKNYGSHVPIFDMLFGTYQWEPYPRKGRVE
ncbi:fatty acid hydroxylase superfamily protein [Acanthamoeba castellanii str. Neff]|uniref:Fatty acid hydroxylase superfamily protein n=1 Tax=Acanthamoeba castellanii (strain ATCC 30010 / Neff) TaxID=1257118 RepID=L8GRB6_ACACF|nr:fatty acid hydroxylase superfamily protein [Acanthamoeba castellanii str. Neff]ELR15188.1 fatty acid hydroxylase superfamily protein [Acanthamoeba castellanii str. Neff]